MTNLLGRPVRAGVPWLFAAGSVVCAAPLAAVTLPVRPVTEVRLVKAQHESLRFHWQAVVSEDGGAFVLLRRHDPSPGEIVRQASKSQRRYEAWWRGPAEPGVYELRYRDARGGERLLAALLVNCHTLGSEPPAQRSGPSRPPAVLPACAAQPPARLARADPFTPLRPEAPARRPPVPPPRPPHAVA